MTHCVEMMGRSKHNVLFETTLTHDHYCTTARRYPTVGEMTGAPESHTLCSHTPPSGTLLITGGGEMIDAAHPHNCLNVLLSCCTLLYPAVPCCTLLYPAVPCCTVLYPAVPCCTLLYPAVPCCTLLYPAVPCCTLLYPAVPCCTLASGSQELSERRLANNR